MILKIMLIGFGHVGQGFADLILRKGDLLIQKYDLNPQVVGLITRSKGKIIDPNGIDLMAALKAARSGQTFAKVGFKTSDLPPIDLIKKLEFDVLIEVSYTNLNDGQPATGFIKTALQNRKHVITTNKGPIALYLSELQEMATAHEVQLLYEGTVMAGTPLINLIKHNLAGLEIRQLRGIVNGSTNFILTRMEEGLEYNQAVDEARKLGYLEADPTSDVEGWDAVAKTMILAATIFNHPLKKEQIKRQGINHLRKKDVEQARQAGKVWKLIASLTKTREGLQASVQPELIDLNHPLAGVRGATNAVTISTDWLHDVTIIGPGAGEYETGYAVLNDLIALFSP